MHPKIARKRWLAQKIDPDRKKSFTDNYKEQYHIAGGQQVKDQALGIYTRKSDGLLVSLVVP